VRLGEGVDELGAVIRVLDAEQVRYDDLRVHQPSLDDVFLAKTGRSLEGAGEEEPVAS
jgi:ABC-2 type transport system ATP-binding protein